MVTITNQYNLPDSFVRYDRRNPHNPDGADYTITTLIDSPQIAQLRKQNTENITEDISDRIWAILGTAVHKVLEDGAGEGEIVEQRFHATINGSKISGQIDLHPPTKDGMILSDYKTIRAYTLQANPSGKQDWSRQLNAYATLARHNDVKVAGLEVIAICRDWSAAAASRSDDYPKNAIIRVPVKMWDPYYADDYLAERISLHQSPDAEECTSEEMWLKPPVFAVHERLASGGVKKRAKRLFDTRTDAESFAMEEQGRVVKKREQEHTRCDSYCSVAQWCKQNYRRLNNGKRT